MGFKDKGAIFENLVYMKIRNKKPCYVYQNGIEIDFHWNDTLLEVKFGEELSGKQKRLFDSFDAKNKFLLTGIRDYLEFTV